MFINDCDHTRKSLQVYRLITVQNSATTVTRSSDQPEKANPKQNITNLEVFIKKQSFPSVEQKQRTSSAWKIYSHPQQCLLCRKVS